MRKGSGLWIGWKGDRGGEVQRRRGAVSAESSLPRVELARENFAQIVNVSH